jgi:hypothetical protein
VLAATIGDLEQRVLLTALYRTEVAMSIAWALTLVETIKPPEEPADLATLDALLPLYAAPSERIASAALRAARVIAEHHARTSELLARARDRHAQHPDDREAGMQLSRAFWRHYGLQWLLGSTSHVEETQVPAF